MAVPRLALVFLLALMGGRCAFAQGDLENARRSLAGVEVFSLDATVEGPEDLALSETLRGETLVRASRQRLREAGLPTGAPGEIAPNLHIHLNMLQLQNGLIAFSVELEFYQDALLVRNRQPTSAVTWNESVVGFVSHDMLSTIAESVLRLVDQFAHDFRTVN